MSQEDRRIRRTRKLLYEALVELISKKSMTKSRFRKSLKGQILGTARFIDTMLAKMNCSLM